MKSGIHPTFYEDASVACTSCGYTYTTGSTKKHIVVEVCSKCHPTYTGEVRFIDSKGRVEQYKQKQEKAKLTPKKSKKKDKGQKDSETKSLKDLLAGL